MGSFGQGVRKTFIALTALALVSAVGFADELFLDTHYYIIPMGLISMDLPSLTEAARGLGYTVIVRGADEVTAYRGGLPTEEGEEELLGDRPLLYIDRGDVLLAFSGSDFDYTLRPSEAGHELVIVPHIPVAQGAAFGIALSQLYGLGIVGSTMGGDAPVAYEKDPIKGPPPPEGVPIDSDIYGLVVASDWFSAAATRGIDRDGLRIAVVAEKLEAATVPPAFRPFVIDETDALVRLLAPIHRIVELAGSGAFRLVRVAYEPQPPAQ